MNGTEEEQVPLESQCIIRQCNHQCCSQDHLNERASRDQVQSVSRPRENQSRARPTLQDIQKMWNLQTKGTPEIDQKDQHLQEKTPTDEK